jgi:hypothetical protein
MVLDRRFPWTVDGPPGNQGDATRIRGLASAECEHPGRAGRAGLATRYSRLQQAGYGQQAVASNDERFLARDKDRRRSNQ